MNEAVPPPKAPQHGAPQAPQGNSQAPQGNQQAPQGNPQAKAAQAPQPIPVEGRDREFLPAALEILETPPSPMPVAFMLTICAFAAAALAWAFIGKLDVHASAWGKIEANGRSKVIQPLDPGKVAAIRVENGAHVKAGDAVVDLDPAEAQADATAAREALAATQAEIIRRRAAVDAARPLQAAALAPAENAAAPTLVFPPEIPVDIQAREQKVLAADLAQLRDTLANLDKQMAQKAATRKRLEASIAYQVALMDTLHGRVGMRQSAIRMNVGTKVNLYDAQEALQKSQAQLASDKGQLVETDAAMAEIVSQKNKAIAQFIADNEGKLAETARKGDETAQQLAKAQARLARTHLTAPIDGVVQQNAVTTIGQVVTTGQQLMTIAPLDGPLQVEAYVSNIDIGFVKAGQEAEVKIDAFPFTRFGTVRGKVVRVAHDAIDEQEARRAQANATATANATAPNLAPGQPQNFVFPILIEMEKAAMKIDGAEIPLLPGMTVTAEVKTDQRRIIDYLMSPIAKIGAEAMKER